MSSKYVIPRTKRQEIQAKSEQVTSVIEQYLEPLVVKLDAYLDKRLVHTFVQGIRVDSLCGRWQDRQASAGLDGLLEPQRTTGDHGKNTGSQDGGEGGEEVGEHVLHIFDRGYAGGPWLELMWKYELQFLIRWKKGHHFLDENGQEKSLGQIGKQYRSWGHRMIWDERKKQTCKTGIVAVRVHHPSYQGAVWVVIVRRGGEPWYLVTNRCIETEAQAWECYYAYCRRWQVETVFGFEKSELAIETIRVWKREKRNKFLHMLSLVHSLLFHLLDEEYRDLLQWLLREYCHRTGKKQREANVPIYRLRWALSRFWQEIRPVFSFPGCVRAPMGGSRGANIRSQSSG